VTLAPVSCSRSLPKDDVRSAYDPKRTSALGRNWATPPPRFRTKRDVLSRSARHRARGTLTTGRDLPRRRPQEAPNRSDLYQGTNLTNAAAGRLVEEAEAEIRTPVVGCVVAVRCGVAAVAVRCGVAAVAVRCRVAAVRCRVAAVAVRCRVAGVGWRAIAVITLPTQSNRCGSVNCAAICPSVNPSADACNARRSQRPSYSGFSAVKR
jgi:hypothetical protein